MHFSVLGKISLLSALQKAAEARTGEYTAWLSFKGKQTNQHLVLLCIAQELKKLSQILKTLKLVPFLNS